jgi:hypothetical protein
MSEPGPDRFLWDEPLLSDAAARGLGRELRRARRAVGTGGTASQSDEGGTSAVVSPPRRAFWASITGRNGTDGTVYSFAEVRRDPASASMPAVGGGMALTDGAREVNANTGVPTGAVVWMVPSPNGSQLYDFEYDASGSPSSPTIGPGQILTLTGLIASPLPAAVTLSSASYTDYALSASSSLAVFNPTAAGGVTINSLVAATPGQQVTIYNSGSVDLTVAANYSGAGSTSYQLSTTWGGNLVIPPCSSATLQAGKGPGGQWGVLNPGPQGTPWQRPAPIQTLTGSVNNFDPGGYGLIPFDPAGGNWNLTGIKPPFPGAMLTVQNVGTSGTLTLTPNDPASSPGNQLSLAGAASVTLQPGQSLDLSVGAGGSFASTTSLNGGGGGGTLAPGGGVPGWVKVVMSAGDFSAAATTNTVTVYTLPPYSVIHGVLVKHTTAFTGGTLTGYNLLSVQGATTYFGGSGSYNLFAAPANVGQGKWQPWAQSGYGSMEDAGSPKVITATVQSIGGNLSLATSGPGPYGSVNIHFLVSTPSAPVAVPPTPQPLIWYVNGSSLS